jgi:hypothetical protein
MTAAYEGRSRFFSCFHASRKAAMNSVASWTWRRHVEQCPRWFLNLSLSDTARDPSTYISAVSWGSAGQTIASSPISPGNVAPLEVRRRFMMVSSTAQPNNLNQCSMFQPFRSERILQEFRTDRREGAVTAFPPTIPPVERERRFEQRSHLNGCEAFQADRTVRHQR